MNAQKYGISLLVFNSISISIVRNGIEQVKRNSISPRAHVLFVYYINTLLKRSRLYLFLKKIYPFHSGLRMDNALPFIYGAK